MFTNKKTGEGERKGETDIQPHVNSYHSIAVELETRDFIFGLFLPILCNDGIIFVIKTLVITFWVLQKKELVDAGGASQSLNFII